MSYIPTNWEDTTTISPELLNKIENGIQSNEAGILDVEGLVHSLDLKSYDGFLSCVFDYNGDFRYTIEQGSFSDLRAIFNAYKTPNILVRMNDYYNQEYYDGDGMGYNWNSNEIVVQIFTSSRIQFAIKTFSKNNQYQLIYHFTWTNNNEIYCNQVEKIDFSSYDIIININYDNNPAIQVRKGSFDSFASLLEGELAHIFIQYHDYNNKELWNTNSFQVEDIVWVGDGFSQIQFSVTTKNKIYYFTWSSGDPSPSILQIEDIGTYDAILNCHWLSSDNVLVIQIKKGAYDSIINILLNQHRIPNILIQMYNVYSGYFWSLNSIIFQNYDSVSGNLYFAINTVGMYNRNETFHFVWQENNEVILNSENNESFQPMLLIEQGYGSGSNRILNKNFTEIYDAIYKKHQLVFIRGIESLTSINAWSGQITMSSVVGLYKYNEDYRIYALSVDATGQRSAGSGNGTIFSLGLPAIRTYTADSATATPVYDSTIGLSFNSTAAHPHTTPAWITTS